MKNRTSFLFLLILVINCGTSRYSLTDKTKIDPSKGLVAFQYEFIDDKGLQVPSESWWMYPLYFFYGPPYLDVYLDGVKTNLVGDGRGFVVFEYPAGELPRNDSCRLLVRQIIFFKSKKIATAYFTKTKDKIEIDANSITVLPKVQINLNRNIYKTVSDEKDLAKMKLYINENYSHLLNEK
ncbi:MAG: hypothetical protein CK427_05440 [Leptospira sp.]|nr:MAG: hypothetical protein CK427_05440 [Leptospira sp.]